MKTPTTLLLTTLLAAQQQRAHGVPLEGPGDSELTNHPCAYYPQLTSNCWWLPGTGATFTTWNYYDCADGYQNFYTCSGADGCSWPAADDYQPVCTDPVYVSQTVIGVIVDDLWYPSE